MLHDLLQGAAQSRPEQEAVRWKGQSLSYGEIARESDRLASALAEHGIRRGDRVGIYFDKSALSIVAIYGILKSGAAYVPVDPLAPPKRASYILSDCQVKALVTTRAKARALEDGLTRNLALVVLTDDSRKDEEPEVQGPPAVTWSSISGQGKSDSPGVRTDPEDLAYILYTSGSTGTPKGVAISHRASLAFVNWSTAEFGLTASDRLSNHAPLHFDLSTFDIFAAAKARASVVLVPPEFSIFPRDLAAFLENESISVWYSVPSVLARLALHGDLPARNLSALRTVLFAGEVFPIEQLRRLMSAIPAARYFNLYGPTETNVCTFFPVVGIPEEGAPTLPIGKPCAGDRVLVVSEQGCLVLPGAEGELLVQGPTLMTGYWGMPEKTEAVFWINREDGLLYYRTGDLVVEREDGNLLFRGRRDDMVKCRGYRIELGEIEAVLYRHPGVEIAAAIAERQAGAEMTIKAVLVVRPDLLLTEQMIRQHCSDYLPRYMVPDRIEFRSSVPRTSSGKVDKKQLTG